MEQGSVPDAVATMLRDRIQTIETLEVLLLLRREQTRGFDSQEVAKKIGIESAEVIESLLHLVSVDLVQSLETSGGRLYRYHPASRELDSVVEELERTYAEKRVEVIRILSRSALDRVRSSAVRMFADAFLIGSNKGKKDG